MRVIFLHTVHTSGASKRFVFAKLCRGACGHFWGFTHFLLHKKFRDSPPDRTVSGVPMHGESSPEHPKFVVARDQGENAF
jgi:hypothetical protein